MSVFNLGAWALILISSLGRAESPQSPPTKAQYPLNSSGSSSSESSAVEKLNPGTVRVLDENFFNPVAPRGKGGAAELAPNGREYATDPDYNSEQREQWLQKCAPYRDKDSKLFRECFQAEKDRMRLELREKFDSVERRQGGKKMSIEDLIRPNSGSGGFD